MPGKCQSLPHDWFGARAVKLEGLPKDSAPICVWIFENGVNVNTTTLTLFPENTRAPGLSAPTLLDGAPLAFQALQRPPCRQAGEKVLPQTRHPFQK